MNSSRQESVDAHRSGTVMPFMIVAVLAACAATAFVLERFWSDATELQLDAAAEAAALAAAGQLANDDRLHGTGHSAKDLTRAQLAAARVAQSNAAAGGNAILDPAKGDIRFGTIVTASTRGRPLFLETELSPDAVHVVTQTESGRFSPLSWLRRASRTRRRGTAWARIDNQVIGIRPLPGSNVPMLPLGILETDPRSSGQQTWETQIEQRRGEDRFGVSGDGKTIAAEPDGLPEMLLTVLFTEEAPAASNVCVVDLGSGLVTHRVREQTRTGISGRDLSGSGGQLVFNEGPLPVDTSEAVLEDCLTPLTDLLGRPRLCLLYQRIPHARSRETDVITGIVAVRIMDLKAGPDTVQIVVQPTVVATRAAVLASDSQVGVNPYLYKLHLVRSGS